MDSIFIRNKRGDILVPYAPEPLIENNDADVSITLEPNTAYVFNGVNNTVNTINFSLGPSRDNKFVSLYHFIFNSGDTPTNITWPTSGLKYKDGIEPEIEANKTYEVCIYKGLVIVNTFE